MSTNTKHLRRIIESYDLDTAEAIEFLDGIEDEFSNLNDEIKSLEDELKDEISSKDSEISNLETELENLRDEQESLTVHDLPLDTFSCKTNNLLYQQCVDEFVAALKENPNELLKQLEELNKTNVYG